jgi:hypothetical protein
MEWLATYEISKDPEIYGDEKKRQEYIRQKRQGLRAKIQEISHPERKPLFAMKPPFDCRVIFHQEAEARRMNPWNFPKEGLRAKLLPPIYFPRNVGSRFSIKALTASR